MKNWKIGVLIIVGCFLAIETIGIISTVLPANQVMSGPENEFISTTFMITNKTATAGLCTADGGFLVRQEIFYSFYDSKNLSYPVTNQTYQKYSVGQNYYYDSSITLNMPNYPISGWRWQMDYFAIAVEAGGMLGISACVWWSLKDSPVPNKQEKTQ